MADAGVSAIEVEGGQRRQDPMKELPVSFADDTPMSSALRELRHMAGARRTWSLLAVVSILAALVGPFGTIVDLALAQRFAYWGLTVAGSFFIAGVSLSAAEGWVAARTERKLAGIVLGAVIAGVPITGLVLVLGYAFRLGGSDAMVVYGHVVAICFCIRLIFLLTEGRQSISADVLPAILDRLPPAKRGRLIRIAVHDHYVDIVTDNGRGMVLMRLKDAVAETVPEPGVRVHRSHWVSVRGVSGCFRSRGRVFLQMRDGARVPVSRSCRGAVRRAGLDR